MVVPSVQATYLGAAAITAATTPTMGNANRYNASSGSLAIALPALAGQNEGAGCTVELDPLQTNLNTATFTRAGSDTFDDGSTSIVLTKPGQKRVLQMVTISGTRYWKVLYGLEPPAGLAALVAELSLASSTTPTTILTTTLPAGLPLQVGSTYKILMYGTIKTKATSGTLTFTPYLQNTALNTIVMPTQTGASGPVAFCLEILITVRASGVSGSAIAHGWGQVNFATPAILATTNTATTTVNTTTAAANTALYVQATWQTSDVANILAVEVATIERVI